METLQTDIYEFIKEAEQPVTILHITNKFGKGDILKFEEDKTGRKYLAAWGMCDDVCEALTSLIDREEIVLGTCDKQIFYDMGVKEADMFSLCTIENGTYDEEDQEYIDLIVSWAPLTFMTEEQGAEYIKNKQSDEQEPHCKYKIVLPGDPMYDESFEDV